MESNKDKIYSIGDVFKQVRLFLAYLLKKWWVLLLFIILGAAIGLLLFSLQKPKYEAVCTFILEENQGGGGGLSGIASQFGFELGGLMGGGSIFAGDNILDILRSKKVVTAVLLSKVPQQKDSITLCDLYLQYSGLAKKLQQKKNITNLNFGKLKQPASVVEDSVLQLVYEQVLEENLVADRISKKGTIVKVLVTAQNNIFARYLAPRLVDEAAKMYLNIKTGTAVANIGRMQRRSDSLLALLNNRSYRAAASQMVDLNPGLKTAAVPVEIATRDKTVIATLYTEVTKNLEASKLLLNQQTPVIQLLDTPGLALEDNRKSKAFLIIISAFVAGLLALVALTLGYLFTRSFTKK